MRENGRKCKPHSAFRSWAPIAGRWSFSENLAVYERPSGTGGEGKHEELPDSYMYGLALGSESLKNGTIRCSIKIDSDKVGGGVFFGFESTKREYFIAQMSRYGKAYAILQYTPAIGWIPLETAGLKENIDLDVSHSLKVDVRSQRVSLTVNEVRVLTAILPSPLKGSGCGLFAYGNGRVDFKDVTIAEERLRAFVIMPLKEPFSTLYEEVIKPEANELEFDIVHPDELQSPGIILEDIRQRIEESHIVVADISEPNPNVFYELGYAHALNKPSILLARRDAAPDLPFDIRSYRAILYDDSIGGKRLVQSRLHQHLEAVRQP